MADDTRVTHPRLGLACVFALVCAIGFALPAVAGAGEPSATGEVVGQGPSEQIPDPYFKDQWALENGNKPDIDVEQAWGVTEGEGVTVAVVDQEIYAAHPDLAENIAPGGANFASADRLRRSPRPRAWTTTGRTSRAWWPPAA